MFSTHFRRRVRGAPCPVETHTASACLLLYKTHLNTSMSTHAHTHYTLHTLHAINISTHTHPHQHQHPHSHTGLLPVSPDVRKCLWPVMLLLLLLLVFQCFFYIVFLCFVDCNAGISLCPTHPRDTMQHKEQKNEEIALPN